MKPHVPNPELPDAVGARLGGWTKHHHPSSCANLFQSAQVVLVAAAHAFERACAQGGEGRVRNYRRHVARAVGGTLLVGGRTARAAERTTQSLNELQERAETRGALCWFVLRVNA